MILLHLHIGAGALIGPASPCKDCPGCFPWEVKPVSDVSPIKQFFLLLVEWLEGI
jgi:hypothetical protein